MRSSGKPTVVTRELWAKWLDQHGLELVELPPVNVVSTKIRSKRKAWNKRLK